MSRPIRPAHHYPSGVFAALDLGTSKVCCLVAKLDGATGQPRVVGIGHQASKGLKSGIVVDLEAAIETVLGALNAAERMAGETVEKVYVNLSGGWPHSETVAVEIPLNGESVADRDLKRVLSQGIPHFNEEERSLIHSIPVGFSVDGHRGIRDPRGMLADVLGCDIHIVTADHAAVRNIKAVLERCHLDTAEMVVSPYAAGLATLVEDEQELGVTVIDMGGGTTTLSVFFEGEVVFTDMVPVGGFHVTNDIARGLSTSLTDAERMKTLHGHALGSPLDASEVLEVPLMGEEQDGSGNTIPKSFLVSIIQPRIEETFEYVRSRLEAGGFDKLAGRRVVLTGGASQLPGVRELGQMVLDKRIRLARPTPLPGLAEATAGPAFATTIGLLLYAGRERHEAVLGTESDRNSMFGRLGAWFRDNF
ncbi:MAG: cell division protein FtsA [Alphaproteobacteria bacterium]|nr:cell division protein FtsA [Alphaproteobacteria bacterium]